MSTDARDLPVHEASGSRRDRRCMRAPPGRTKPGRVRQGCGGPIAAQRVAGLPAVGVTCTTRVLRRRLRACVATVALIQAVCGLTRGRGDGARGSAARRCARPTAPRRPQCGPEPGPPPAAAPEAGRPPKGAIVPAAAAPCPLLPSLSGVRVPVVPGEPPDPERIVLSRRGCVRRTPAAGAGRARVGPRHERDRAPPTPLPKAASSHDTSGGRPGDVGKTRHAASHVPSAIGGCLRNARRSVPGVPTRSLHTRCAGRVEPATSRHEARRRSGRVCSAVDRASDP